MPRKGPAPKRPLINDPVYGSPLVTQLVNKILLDGKKSTAERIVYQALEQAREKTGTDPVVTLKRAWTTSSLHSRFVAAASVALPTRCRSRFAPVVPPRWHCAGWSPSRVHVVRRPWSSVSPTSSSMPAMASVQL